MGPFIPVPPVGEGDWSGLRRLYNGLLCLWGVRDVVSSVKAKTGSNDVCFFEILGGSRNSERGSRNPHMNPFDIILHFLR